MVSAIGENLNSQMAASGTLGSPAGAIKAAMRFSGASEDIRSQRLNNAQRALEQIGGASIMPSASQFLQVGANKASQAANLEMQAGEQIQQVHAQHKAEMGAGYGALAGIGLAPFTGGMSMGMLGGGLQGMFGGGGGGLPADPHNIRGARGFGPMSDAEYGSGGRMPFGFGGGGWQDFMNQTGLGTGGYLWGGGF